MQKTSDSSDDATLIDMATRMPKTPEEMRDVSGMGDRKLEKYGREFLAVLADHAEPAPAP